MGLVNPIDETSSTKYIVVDRKAGKEESTGDLDYDAIVENGMIKVTWTSYSEEAAKTIPESWSSDKMLKAGQPAGRSKNGQNLIQSHRVNLRMP